MDHMAQFITNHWQLWLALVILLAAIFIQELLAQKKRAEELSPAAAVQRMNHDHAVVIDLRDTEAFRTGHIIDSIHATPDEFTQQRMDKYKSKPIIFVCAKGLQSAALAAKLRGLGFTKPMVLAGGIAAWQTAGLPLTQ
ncbi:MAG TPA: rhodanese-like domain-containing protein [Legionella sp.]|nr:rhodanese-like domain-containing protein [Legionella sp.]